MNSEKFSEALGNISETYIDNAAQSYVTAEKKRRRIFRVACAAAAVLVLTNWVKSTKKWHPIVFIAISAVVGVAFGFAGV